MAHKPGASYGSRAQPSHDIYTVLVGIALAVVAGAIGYVLYRCDALLGTPFPGFVG